MNEDGDLLLLNPKGHNITFDNQGQTIKGIEHENGEFSYLFNNANTIGPKKLGPLYFYTQENNVWKWRVEVTPRQAELIDTKALVYMFVLDCSRSIGKIDFEAMKKQMIVMIDKLTAYNTNDNIYVGLITFSNTVEQFHKEIQPLSKYNANGMRKYIEGLDFDYQTSLYRAMDTAVAMIDRFHMRDIEISEINLITFTDGSDNMSRDKSRGFNTPAQYMEYLSKEIAEREKWCRSSYIFMTGIEENSSAQEEVGNRLAQNVYRAENMDEVMKKMEEIIDESVTRNTRLNLFIPIYDGKNVAWVMQLDKPIKEKVIEPTEPSENIKEFGIIAGLIDGLSYKFYNPKSHFAFELDFGAFIWPSEECIGYEGDYYKTYDHNVYGQTIGYRIHDKWADAGLPYGVSASILYQKGFNSVTHGFIGANVRGGVNEEDNFGGGINGMIGLEWIWKHFAIQIDTRMGYGYQNLSGYELVKIYKYDDYGDAHYYDTYRYSWNTYKTFTDFSANLSLRYRW